MRYEVRIFSDNEVNPKERRKLEDLLIKALARFGYAPYLSDDSGVCFTVDESEMHKLRED